jgi:hypothetical protein
MQTTEPYLLSIFWRDGERCAVQYETKTVIRDDEGAVVAERPNPASELPLEIGEEVLGLANAGLVARIAELEAEVAALRNPPAPETPPVLTQLATTFAALPPEIQVAFAPAFAVVRTLVQGGRADLAAAYVAALEVPAELTATRDGIVATLQGGGGGE